MKFRRSIIVIGIGCLILTGMGVILYRQAVSGGDYNSASPGDAFIQIDTEEDLAGTIMETPQENPGIYYEGTLLPYDKTAGRLYLPQDYRTDKWQGNLSAVLGGENRPLYILRDEMTEKKREAVRENHDFIIYVQADGEEYYKFLLTVTGMPLISMNTDYEEEAEEITYEEDPDKFIYGSETRYRGTFLMIDPGTRNSQHQITEAAVRYHYKGMSSHVLDKKSYSFDLFDYRGEKVNVSLAGMRSDSKWKLNALYTDKNRVREITASQIWELIDDADKSLNEAGPNMEYVELIIDSEYKGVYCLAEPIDAKKMELQESDILYKILDWDIPEREDIRSSVENGWNVQFPVRIRYPKEIDDYQRAWAPIDDYLEMFYRGGEVQYEEAIKHINLDNYCDALIFNMAVTGSDNYFKNKYYVCECDEGVQDYRMKQIPWDLDLTFGNYYVAEEETNSSFDADYQKIYEEAALPRLYEENPEEIGARLNERWEKYRSSFLSTEHINAMLEENRDYLLETGAFLREQERWPQSGADMDIEYLKEFQRNRMDWLDEYFQSWLVE